MNFLALLLKRPSDKQIKHIKIAFSILVIIASILAVGVQNLEIQDSIFGQTLSLSAKEYIGYGIIGLGFIPLILGGLDISILTRGRTRILQAIFGVLLMYISGLFEDSATLGANIILFLLGLAAIIAGISGKLITDKGRKHGQKITKVRV